MILYILIALAVLVAVFIVVVSLRPADFRIARSIDISAPPEAAFEQVNDLHRWQAMSPYAKLDLNAKYTFEGPPAGPGASMAWEGNSHVGSGKMTITESRPNELVKMDVEFLKPFKAVNLVDFTFEEAGNQTRATWSMAGQSNFVCKAMGLFMSMDKMCGTQFEEGLANMKKIAEAESQKLAPRGSVDSAFAHQTSDRFVSSGNSANQKY